MDSPDHEGFAPIRAFAGAPQEVGQQLEHFNDRQIVAVVLDQSNATEAKIIEQVLVQIVQLTQQTLVTRSDGKRKASTVWT